MRPVAGPTGSEAGSDPYFQSAEVGPAKSFSSPMAQGERGHRRYRRRVATLGIVLAIVWAGVLLDPNMGTLVLSALAAFGAVVGLCVAVMGLGLLGFGLGSAGDRFIGWLRRGARWPEE